jgi:hypothetical protein
VGNWFCAVVAVSQVATVVVQYSALSRERALDPLKYCRDVLVHAPVMLLWQLEMLAAMLVPSPLKVVVPSALLPVQLHLKAVTCLSLLEIRVQVVAAALFLAVLAAVAVISKFAPKVPSAWPLKIQCHLLVVLFISQEALQLVVQQR